METTEHITDLTLAGAMAGAQAGEIDGAEVGDGAQVVDGALVVDGAQVGVIQGQPIHQDHPQHPPVLVRELPPVSEVQGGDNSISVQI